MKQNKTLLIDGLLVIVLLMVVGYAAFATQLNINGTATITSNWDVHISSIDVDPEGTVGTATNDDGVTKVNEEDSLTANFGTNLLSPGDSITYKITVVNEGTLPAKLEKITFDQKNTGGDEPSENLTQEQLLTNPIVYTYSDIQENDVLPPTIGTVTFKVTVTYNNAIQTQPTAQQLKSNLTMTLQYVENKS